MTRAFGFFARRRQLRLLVACAAVPFVASQARAQQPSPAAPTSPFTGEAPAPNAPSPFTGEGPTPAQGAPARTPSEPPAASTQPEPPPPIYTPPVQSVAPSQPAPAPAQPYAQQGYAQGYPPPGYPPPGYPPPGYPPPYVEPPPPEAPWPTLPEPDYLRHRISLQTEAVFSADEGPFYNHLLGARYDIHASRSVTLGGYVGYANLKGTVGRVHSTLLMTQFAYRITFGSKQRLIVPLRAGLGYLVKNGVAVRFATGVYYALDENLEVGFDLIAPTFWTAHNDTVISMSLAAEVGFAF